MFVLVGRFWSLMMEHCTFFSLQATKDLVSHGCRYPFLFLPLLNFSLVSTQVLCGRHHHRSLQS